MQSLENLKAAVEEQKEAMAKPERLAAHKARLEKIRMKGVPRNRHQIEAMVEVRAGDVVEVADSITSPSQIVKDLRTGAAAVRPGLFVLQQLRDVEHLIASAAHKTSTVKPEVTKPPEK